MSLVRPKTLRELALEHLRSEIIDGTLKMGQILSERKISDQLGVSKSPVREALAQLRDEGLITIEPQKGARVFELSNEEVAQICDFRQAIEMAAFELAIKRNYQALVDDLKSIITKMKDAKKKKQDKRYLSLDTDFHQCFFVHCDNDYLYASYERYVGKIAALRTHLSLLPDHTSLSFDEHIEITKLAGNKDLKKIRKIIKEHIDRTRQCYRDGLENLNR
jgi:DNA-binding GntR family transcriptional regulator